MKTNLSSCCNAEVEKSQVSNKDFCVDCGEFCDLASPEDWENDLADLLDNGTPTEIRDFVRGLLNKNTK